MCLGVVIRPEAEVAEGFNSIQFFITLSLSVHHDKDDITLHCHKHSTSGSRVRMLCGAFVQIQVGVFSPDKLALLLHLNMACVSC